MICFFGVTAPRFTPVAQNVTQIFNTGFSSVAELYHCWSLPDSSRVGKGGARAQFVARCIWNCVAVDLATAVRASVDAVPQTIVHPSD